MKKLIFCSLIIILIFSNIYSEEVTLIVGGETFSKEIPNTVEECKSLIYELAKYYNDLDKSYTDLVNKTSKQMKQDKAIVDEVKDTVKETKKENTEKIIEIEKAKESLGYSKVFTYTGVHLGFSLVSIRSYNFTLNYLHGFNRVYIIGGCGLSVTKETKTDFYPIVSVSFGIRIR